MENGSKKKCLECGHEFYGRSDKKFCSTNCKNKFHNHFSHRSTRVRERIFTDLSSNHRILLNLLKMGVTSLSLYELESLGFKPTLITGYARRQKYDELRCFDVCYRQTPERIYEIRIVDMDGARRACRAPLQQSYDTSH